MPKKSFKSLKLFLALSYGVFVLLYKLDAHYMFTDEVLYVQAGREYIKGDYTLNLQHPLVGKYISSITSNFSNDVFLLRLPFALIGVVSAYLVFKILSTYYNFELALLGLLVHFSLPFLSYTNRSVLLESPMYLFWLIFSYFVLKFSKTTNFKYFYLAAVSLGLCFSTKYTSIVLLPGLAYMFFINKKRIGIKHVITFILIAIFVYFLHYIHLFIEYGPYHFVNVLRPIKDIFIKRNFEGKLQVINGIVYKSSPWWFYFYYIKSFYNPLLFLGLIGVASFGVLRNPLNYNVRYWFLLTIFAFIFIQSLPLKNYRYLSSIELPLIFLFIEGVKGFYDKYKAFYILCLVTVIFAGIFASMGREPNSYHKAYLYLSKKTNNFSNNERVLIFGSFRSARWYFTGPNDIVVVRKDLEPLQDELFKFNFNYILVDEVEKAKYPNNILFIFLDSNDLFYRKTHFDNLTLYELVN